MEWPYRRFLKAFDAFTRRTLCDEWRQRKIADLAALTANTNLDGEDADRAGVTARLEESYNKIIARIWNGETGDAMTEEDKAAWNSPLMQAGRRAIQGAVRPMVLPGQEVLEALPSE